MEFCDLAIADGIATVTLRRPEKMNALHLAASRELDGVFDGLERDDAVRVVIVTGAGRAFCAGFDLLSAGEGVPEMPPGGFAGMTLRTGYRLPVIAAVNGVAMGGGFELALAADVIVASEGAKFALPEVKWGWAALGGGIQRLVRAVGTKQAMGVLLTGRSVSAEEGLRLGFVNEVAADALAAAQGWAAQILACGPMAVRVTKQVGYASLDQPDFAAAMTLENYPEAEALFSSADSVEGPKAFAEKRKPVWTGR